MKPTAGDKVDAHRMALLEIAGRLPAPTARSASPLMRAEACLRQAVMQLELARGYLDDAADADGAA